MRKRIRKLCTSSCIITWRYRGPPRTSLLQLAQSLTAAPPPTHTHTPTIAVHVLVLLRFIQHGHHLQLVARFHLSSGNRLVLKQIASSQRCLHGHTIGQCILVDGEVGGVMRRLRSTSLVEHPHEVVVCLGNGLRVEGEVLGTHQWLLLSHVVGANHLTAHLRKEIVKLRIVDCWREERLIFVKEVHNCAAALDRCLCDYDLFNSLLQLIKTLLHKGSEGTTYCHGIRDNIEGSTTLKLSNRYYLQNKANKKEGNEMLGYTGMTTGEWDPQNNMAMLKE